MTCLDQKAHPYTKTFRQNRERCFDDMRGPEKKHARTLIGYSSRVFNTAVSTASVIIIAKHKHQQQL